MSSVKIKNISRKIFQGMTDINRNRIDLVPQAVIEVESNKAAYLRNSYPNDLVVIYEKEKKTIEDKWKLSLIPKIAMFYWEGNILPWIRMMSFVSFHKLNPEWEVRVYIPKKKYSGENTWNTGEQSYQIKTKDYFDYMRKEYPNIKIIEFDFDTIDISSEIPHVFKADFLRFFLLSTVGGLWLDSDIIFFKSMNEFYKNKIEFSNKETWLCFNKGYHSCGFLMSSRNNKFFRDKFKQSKEVFNIKNYQGVFIEVLDLKEDVLIKYDYENIRMDIVYPLDSFNIPLIYNSDNSNLFTQNTIGLHFYAGHKLAAKFINELNENNYNYDNTICSGLKRYFKKVDKSKFYIITIVRNAEDYIKKCVDSIINQSYNNWEMIIVDDNSTDKTTAILKNYNNPEIKIIFNPSPKTKIQNIINAIDISCPNDDDVIVMLDGDDWLADNNVLTYLSNIYSDNNTYITYGQFEPVSKKYSNWCKPIDIKTYRKEKIWKTSHLKTFKYKLWKNINHEDFLDKNNEFLKNADDVAMMLPMLEMAGDEHTKFIDKVLYVYNDLNPNCKMYSKESNQEEIKNYIFNKPCYKQIGLPKISMLITTFKRTHLLKWNLESISKQDLSSYNFEILILDEHKETKEIKELIKNYNNLNIKYINTGKTKKNFDEWRIPGYAINIGLRHCTGNYIVMSCAEIFSLNNTIDKLITPLLKDHKIITTSGKARDDVKGVYIEQLMEHGKPLYDLSNFLIPLNTLLPFFMGVWKRELFDIGGYDEDFTGIARDDDDLVNRLIGNGCRYEKVDAEIIHLYHDRIYNQRMIDVDIKKRVEYNDMLYKKRKGTIKRNINKEWGKYETV